MTHVEEAIAEIDELLDGFAPIAEGLRDYNLLNLIPSAHTVISEAITDYDRRISLLNQARQTLVALLEDGHPDITRRHITPTAFQDLQYNASTIEAALGIFTAAELAAMLGLGAGPVEEK